MVASSNSLLRPVAIWGSIEGIRVIADPCGVVSLLFKPVQ
jgi:hypothetical protein